MKTERVRDNRGAAAVEFAVVLPVLLLIVFGIVDFSLAYNAKVSLSGAAREGARALALGQTAEEVETVTKRAAPSLDEDGDGLAEIAVAQNTCTSPGSEGQVSATKEYAYITPLPAFVGFAGTVTLTGIGVMRCGG